MDIRTHTIRRRSHTIRRRSNMEHLDGHPDPYHQTEVKHGAPRWAHGPIPSDGGQTWSTQMDTRTHTIRRRSNMEHLDGHTDPYHQTEVKHGAPRWTHGPIPSDGGPIPSDGGQTWSTQMDIRTHTIRRRSNMEPLDGHTDPYHQTEVKHGTPRWTPGPIPSDGGQTWSTQMDTRTHTIRRRSNMEHLDGHPDPYHQTEVKHGAPRWTHGPIPSDGGQTWSTQMDTRTHTIRRRSNMEHLDGHTDPYHQTEVKHGAPRWTHGPIPSGLQPHGGSRQLTLIPQLYTEMYQVFNHMGAAVS